MVVSLVSTCYWCSWLPYCPVLQQIAVKLVVIVPQVKASIRNGFASEDRVGQRLSDTPFGQLFL
jgi:hypothetical protein